MSLFKRPESVLVVISTQHGEVLQMRRHDPADFWQSVSSPLQENETLADAARRAVREETGLLPDHGLTDTGVVNTYPMQVAWLARIAGAARENTEHVFSLQLPAIDAVRIDLERHAEYRWLSREEALKLAGSPSDRDAIAKLVAAKNAT
ncbi:MAG: dihydroneopterin triphosphate diphosphatase [Gammaproteobacteria bacterium]